MFIGGVGGALSTCATLPVRRWLSYTGRGAVVPIRIHVVATMHEQAQEAGSCQQQLTTTGRLVRGKHQVGRALSRPSMTWSLPCTRALSQEKKTSSPQRLCTSCTLGTSNAL